MALIRESLILGQPHASESDLHKARRLVGADGFVTALREGYDTVLGEAGLGLQAAMRLAFMARAKRLGSSSSKTLDRRVAALWTVFLHGLEDHALYRLRLYAKRLGRLHADTQNECESWTRHHMSLRLVSLVMESEAGPNSATRRLMTALETTGLSLTDACIAELVQISRIGKSFGPYSALTHNDPWPDNFVFDGRSLRLVNFEFARMSQGTLNISAVRMAFPTCWCAGSFPDHIVQGLEDIYRDELASHCRLAGDDPVFEVQLALACGFCLAQTLIWHRQSALRGPTTWCTAALAPKILHTLKAFLAYPPAFADLAKRLTRHLVERWPEDEPLARFPRLAKEGG